MMHVLVADLHEDAATLGQQFPHQQQAVAQVGEVGVDAQLPGVAESADLLRLGGQVLVLAVLHVALVHERLKVGAVLDAVGGIDVDHLHLARHALLFQKRVHHQQAVPGHKPVAPAMGVLVKVDGVAQRLFALYVKKQGLRICRLAAALPYRLDDRARVDPFVDVQRNGGHLKRCMLRLSCPLKLWVQMWIIGIGLLRPRIRVRLRRHEANRRVVDALLVWMLVGFDWALLGFGRLFSCHVLSAP